MLYYFIASGGLNVMENSSFSWLHSIAFLFGNELKHKTCVWFFCKNEWQFSLAIGTKFSSDWMSVLKISVVWPILIDELLIDVKDVYPL